MNNFPYEELELFSYLLLRTIHHSFTPSRSGDEDIKIKPVPNEVDIPEFLNMKGENNNGNKNYL